MLKNILYGLIPAQVIAFFHVYFSNLNLFAFLTVASRAGYLIVPGKNLLPGLKAPGPAFFGGLFFTLTVGAALAILSYCFCWIWVHRFKRNRFFLIFILALWLVLILSLNLKGFAIFPSLYLIIIPITVSLATLSSLSGQPPLRKRLSVIICLSPILILGVLWTREYDQKMFLDIRDNLLLSNKIGQKINHFYYQYTLYPAEAFKSLEQKQLKGCYIKPINDRDLTARLETELLNHDYLILDSPAEIHLGLQIKEGILYFNHSGEVIYHLPVFEFFSDPEAALKTYSQKADTNGLFRYLTFLSLLGGFPLLLYLIIYSVLAKSIRFFVQPEWSKWIASCLCLGLGLIILFLFQAHRSPNLPPNDIGQALQSSAWQQRTAALRLINEKNLEIDKYRPDKALLTSSHIAEKYWLAKALGKSRRNSTMQDIFVLVEDSHPNVACMALEALGKRKGQRSIQVTLRKMKSSRFWYLEWHAYRALRALGWKQKRST